MLTIMTMTMMTTTTLSSASLLSNSTVGSSFMQLKYCVQKTTAYILPMMYFYDQKLSQNNEAESQNNCDCVMFKILLFDCLNPIQTSDTTRHSTTRYLNTTLFGVVRRRLASHNTGRRRSMSYRAVSFVGTGLKQSIMKLSNIMIALYMYV